MADEIKVTNQYLSLEGLKKYDALIKKFVNDGDAPSIKAVSFSGDPKTGTGKLSFFKNTEMTGVAAYEIDLATFYATDAELADVNKKIGAINAVDGSGLNEHFDLVRDSATVVAALNEIANEIGDMSKLKDAEGNQLTVVEAIEKVKSDLEDADENHVVTMTSSVADLPDDVAKRYTIKQGKNAQDEDIIVGTIDIPKDLVVSEGSVVEFKEGDVLPEGVEQPGTYIKLVIANHSKPLYIAAADLVDVYTAKENATQVQLKVEGTEISASIVAKSITATELADDAVETAKIKDANVTEAKLAANAVTEAKINLGAVTTDKIKDANVTEGKLAKDAVTTDKIKDANITTAKVADKAITEEKLDETLQGWIDDVSGLLGLSEGEEGEEVVTVAKQIENAVNNLDSVATSVDVADGMGLKITVTQTDGKLVQKTAENNTYGVTITGSFDKVYEPIGALEAAQKYVDESVIADADIEALFQTTPQA